MDAGRPAEEKKETEVDKEPLSESVSFGWRLAAVVGVAIIGMVLLYLAYMLISWLFHHLLGVSIAAAIATILGAAVALFLLVQTDS